MTNQFEFSEEGILKALEFLEEELHRRKTAKPDIIKTRLLAEECLFKLSKNAPSKTTFKIWVHSFFGNVTTSIKCRGKKIKLTVPLKSSRI